MPERVLLSCLARVVLAWVLSASFSGRVAAQDGGPWSAPIVLFEARTASNEDGMPINGTSLVAASDGSLHAFWGVGRPIGESAIYYAHNDGQSWSEPVDILVGPDAGRANGDLSVALDGRGYLHLLWHNVDLYYSRAHLSQAAHPRGWSAPLLVASGANTSALTIDDEDRLHIAYTEVGSRIAVTYVRYNAYGEQEIPPVRIAEVVAGEAAANPSILAASGEMLHLAWGQFELPDGWPATGVYYANSADGGATWSWPAQMGAGRQGHPALAHLLPGELHLVMLGGLGEGRHYTRSLDGGQTWQPAHPFSPAEISGLNVGFPRFATDSSGQFFLCMGGGPGGRDDVNCTRWHGAGWEDLTPVARGFYPSLAVSRGNRLHLIYTDGDTIFYMQRRTDAMAIPPLAVPTALAEPEPQVRESEAQPASTPSAVPAVRSTIPAPDPVGETARGLEPWMPVAAGIVPALALVGAVVLLSRRTRPYR